MVSEKLKALISEQFGVDIETISAETNIIDDLGADSLDIVELIMLIEDEFMVSIPNEDILNLKTVGDVINYIEDHA